MGASLVILAAGMGSRYGGLKQIDAFGPHGESLLEYAVYDALQAGFNHIVFIIRRDFSQEFCDKFAPMLAACPEYDLVFQEVDPEFSHISTVQREKPRGTLHATLCAHEVIKQPFAVINADDRYGNNSYAMIYDELIGLSEHDALLVGYTLGNTLSDHGNVNRGICDVDMMSNTLIDVKEHYALGYNEQGDILDRDGNYLKGNEIVSMNFWGFHPCFLEQAIPLFDKFVRAHAQETRAEMVIPDGVDVLLRQGVLTCRVLPSIDGWQGVTNPEDKPKVQQAFDGMINDGMYPNSLRK